VNFNQVDKIANAVLYEGYMLYPYRPSAVKNQPRWNFGTLYPPQFTEVRSGTERSVMHVECLLREHNTGRIGVRVRFLQFATMEAASAWRDSTERNIDFAADIYHSDPMVFEFPGTSGTIQGSLRLSAEKLGGGLVKVCLDLVNESQISSSCTREEALSAALQSAHLILHAESGEFVSFLDTPGEFRESIAGCRNTGCFPVLVGDEGQRDLLLCSPIILYDYPQVAPESAGDFFDGTEMDEMLTLRVMTLTDEEKSEIRASDRPVRDLLDRTEQTAREQLMRTHGTIRSMRQVNEHE